MKLSRVLIIGDSISMGYTDPVRHILSSEAIVMRPDANCASTLEGLEHLEEWLGAESWDLIHFNWGLHDLKYMGPAGENLADPEDPASRQKVPPEEYGKNLTALIERMKPAASQLLWCTTPPIPAGAQGRVAGDSVKYNAIAAQVMAHFGIGTDDLFAFAAPRLEAIQQPANVHFTEDGSRLLAGQVAASIRNALEGTK